MYQKTLYYLLEGGQEVDKESGRNETPKVNSG
jgi:hypothetical protein